jgi:hypothetical protein
VASVSASVPVGRGSVHIVARAIERILRQSSAQQRGRVLDALREVQSVVDQVEGRR